MNANRAPVDDLRGRQVECQTLNDHLDRTRKGRGGGLVIRGDPGVGKTALLNVALAMASDMRPIRLAGAQLERRIMYAGLHQLCSPLGDLLDDLPNPQADALQVGLGLRPGPAPSRLLVGLAVVGLLEAASRDAPVLCVIDDAHWLDRASAQTLLFAARRIDSVPASLIFAARPGGVELSGLAEMTVGGLRDPDAQELLADVMPCPLDERIRDLIIAETRGNPGTLSDLPRVWSPAELAGGFGLADAAFDGVSDSLARKLGALPDATRLLVVIAAADPTGDPELVWRAAGHLGISPGAAVPAAEAGLLTLGRRILFRHPVVRSAAYRSASPRDRRDVHRALALATLRQADEDRRAWHEGYAARGPDERLAGDLERAAAQAQVRAGFPAAAAFLERAAYLTTDPSLRSRRALAAAERTLPVGASDATTKLLDLVDTDQDLSGEQQARTDVLRAVTQARARIGDTPQHLLDAARRLNPLDAEHALAAYRDALATSMNAAGLATPGCTPREVAIAVTGRGRGEQSSALTDLVDGVAACLTGDYVSGMVRSRVALRDFGRGLSPEDELRWLPLACSAALWSWDDRAWDSLASRWVRLARESGALADLPSALGTAATSALVGGDLAAADSLGREAEVAADVCGLRWLPSGAAALAVLRARPRPASATINRAIDDATARGAGLVAAAATWAEAVLHNARGQYQEAFSAAERAVGYAGLPVMSAWAMAELVEAGCRTGRRADIAPAVRDLSEITGAAGTDWALGVRSRTLALVSYGAAAETHYQEAIASLTRCRARLYLGRTHLLYGEWLRRENRRVDARHHLRLASVMLETMGADGFADRARRELLATGQKSRDHVPEASELTAQELQIAIRAHDGHTNVAIGNELFLSPRTVEWHLRKVFMKLGISSRRQIIAHPLGAPTAPNSVPANPNGR